MARVAKESSHIRVRLELTLLTRLKKDAEKNGLTLTGAITQRLEKSFDPEDMTPTLEYIADRIVARMRELP